MSSRLPSSQASTPREPHRHPGATLQSLRHTSVSTLLPSSPLRRLHGPRRPRRSVASSRSGSRLCRLGCRRPRLDALSHHTTAAAKLVQSLRQPSVSTRFPSSQASRPSQTTPSPQRATSQFDRQASLSTWFPSSHSSPWRGIDHRSERFGIRWCSHPNHRCWRRPPHPRRLDRLAPLEVTAGEQPSPASALPSSLLRLDPRGEVVPAESSPQRRAVRRSRPSRPGFRHRLLKVDPAVTAALTPQPSSTVARLKMPSSHSSYPPARAAGHAAVDPQRQLTACGARPLGLLASSQAS